MSRLLYLASCLALTTSAAANGQAVTKAAVVDPLGTAPSLMRGTDVELMVTKEVNSRTAKAGDRIKLRVNAPVLAGDKVAIPIGAPAWAEVVTVSGTSAAGGRGQLSIRLLSVETPWGARALTGANGTEGKSNTAGVVFGVLSFGVLGLLNKGGNATFKAGEIIHGSIADGEAPAAEPLRVGG